MKSPWPIAAALVLAGLLAWFLLSGGDPDPGADDYSHDPSGTTARNGEGPIRAEEAGLAGASPRGRAKRSRGPNPYKPLKERTGTLEILPVDPDGEPVAADLCNVTIERVNPPEAMGKLGLRDRETGVWTFKKVPIGTIKVIVSGDHIVEGRKNVRVREGVATLREIPVELGALVRFKAVMPDGEAPKQVKLQLINAQGRPASVYWQSRNPRLTTSARRATQIQLPAEGVVFGLRPGRYELRAEAADEFDATSEIVVGPGDTEEVLLELRR